MLPWNTVEYIQTEAQSGQCGSPNPPADFFHVRWGPCLRLVSVSIWDCCRDCWLLTMTLVGKFWLEAPFNFSGDSSLLTYLCLRHRVWLVAYPPINAIESTALQRKNGHTNPKMSWLSKKIMIHKHLQEALVKSPYLHHQKNAACKLLALFNLGKLTGMASESFLGNITIDFDPMSKSKNACHPCFKIVFG